MTRKKWIAVLAAALALLVAAGCAVLFWPKAPIDETKNLISNGGFEAGSGAPEGWAAGRWHWDEGVSYLSLSGDAYSGAASVCVENAEENDARFEQAVAVEPNALYRISCMVKAEGCQVGRAGAGLSVADTFISSDYAYDTHGEWTRLTLYGRTGADQKRMTVMCRVGGYGSLNVGRAWFDDVEVVRLAAAPEDAVVKSLATNKPASSDAEGQEPEADWTLWILLVGALFALAAAAVALRRPGEKEDPKRAAWVLGVALTAGIVARAALAVTVRGFEVDMNCFEGWAERMAQKGPWGFYNAGWCDYPPGYMLVLWPFGLLRGLLGVAYDSPVHWLLVKIPPMVCDVLTALLLARTTRERLGRNGAAWLAAAYLLNPAVIVNAAMWGQVDSVLTLLLLAAVCAAARGRWRQALLAFACAALCKPQALMFAPLGLLALVCEIAFAGKRRREILVRIGGGLLAALGAALILTLPFSLGQGQDPFTWLWARYTQSLSEYNYITVNACNLFQLMNMNWKALDPVDLWTAVFWGLCLALAGLAAWVFARKRTWRGPVALGALALIALLVAIANVGWLNERLYWLLPRSVSPWALLGWAAYPAAFALAIWFYAKARKRRSLFLLCAMALAVIFAFGAKMHERYLYPAVALLLMAYAADRDARELLAAVAVSVSLFINETVVLADTYITGHRAAAAVASFVNVEAAQLLVWTAWDLCVKKRRVTLKNLVDRVSAGGEPSAPRDARLNLTRRDWAVMLSVTGLYAALAFVNLGSLTAPQTAWTSSAAGEGAVFELEESAEFHLTYYGGICNSSFTVAFSEDGQTWSDPELAQYDQGQIFRWLWFTPQQRTENGKWAALEDGNPTRRGKYVRLTAEKAGLVLHEVAFLAADGTPLPIAGATGFGGDDARAGDPALLWDEQDTVPPHPSYYNSTYFDEIYHARTGYEFAHGLNPYETTHPPLGKVFIMLGIQLFGMTPFGWRFMGALFGVLMLPVMYLMVKQLLKRTEYAALGMALLALDAMHFTQTRIATIDTYGVFFILLMYLFMFRYCQMNFYTDGLLKTLVPLGLCGVSMGLGIASKWICIYAAIGLAVLFFHTMLRRYLEYRRAMAAPEETPQNAAARRLFWKYFLLTGVFCVAFFIVAPALIYYFSYDWYMKPSGGLSLEKVWRSQQYMFNYHKDLTNDTHFFKSPWYEWPLIVKPMWYYSGTAFQPEGWISSISCMGNPAVWWTGLVALMFVRFQWWNGKTGRTGFWVVLGFMAQFLPWLLVPRSTFIYHYFASVPFIIVCTVMLYGWLRGRSKRNARVFAGVLLGAALLLFVAFYPLESGLPVPRAYANLLRWFNWYNF